MDKHVFVALRSAEPQDESSLSSLRNCIILPNTFISPAACTATDAAAAAAEAAAGEQP